jgi:hypothetical protein
MGSAGSRGRAMIAAFSGELAAFDAQTSVTGGNPVTGLQVSLRSGDLVDPRALSRGQGGENRRLGGGRARLVVGARIRRFGLA